MPARTKKTMLEGNAKPLTSAQVSRLRALPPESDPPATIRIAVGTFRLSEAARAVIVPVEGSDHLFQVEVDLAGRTLGRRATYDSIPAVKLAQPVADFQNQIVRVVEAISSAKEET